jgi:hypothetical protein
VCVYEGPKNKKERKVMSLLQQVRVLDKLDRGMNIAVVDVIMV